MRPISIPFPHIMRRKIQLAIIEIYKKLIALLQMQLKLKQKGFEQFSRALGRRESGNNYQAVNSLGYLGRWQFGMARLTDLGIARRQKGIRGWSNSAFEWIPPYSKEGFLNDKVLQDKIFKNHVRRLSTDINVRFGNHIGKKRWGIMITLSGLVAGAHLGGIGGVQRFLDKGLVSSDIYGTTVSNYIRKFAGYDLSKVGQS